MTIIVNEVSHVPLDSLLRHLIPQLPELPYEMAVDMVRQRYIEFARKSGMLRYYQELPIQKDVTNYFLEPPEDYEVYAVRAVGSPIDGKWFPATQTYWFSAWGHNIQAYGTTQVIFSRPPVKDESGRYVLLTLVPASCAASMPAPVATLWGRAIAEGAAATALLMPGKGWTNPGLAGKKELDFNRAVQAARNNVLTENGSKSAEFKPVRIL